MKLKFMILLTIEFLLFQACSVKHVATQDRLQQQSEALMLEAIEDFISSTPYCALIQHTSVDVSPDPNDPHSEINIYHAKVLETFRGQQFRNISYILISDKGSDPTLVKQPVIITLCSVKDGFFWPGTGSMFEATEEVIKKARRIGQKLKFVKQPFPDCE